MGGGEDSGGPKAPLKPLTALFSYLLRLLLNSHGLSQQIMKEIDDTDPHKSESECPCCAALALRVAALEVQIADLHHRRAVSREQADDTDPEWF